MPISRKDILKAEEEKKKKRNRFFVFASFILIAGIATGVILNIIFGKNPVLKEEKPKSIKKERKTVIKKSQEGESSSPEKSALYEFSNSRAMEHVFALSEQIGARPAGSIYEARAADYIVRKLGEYGYAVEEQPFTMPDGLGSRNIVATLKGEKEGYIIVLGAHFDSSPDSKGAIDNASGVGGLLELARILKNKNLKPTIKFVFFGGNKLGEPAQELRFQGAKQFVDGIGTMEKNDYIGMISLDSIGAGDTLAMKTQEKGYMRLRDKLATYAREKGIEIASFKSEKDSDNIPFEDGGIPSVWILWCNSTGEVTAPDAYGSVAPTKIETVGRFIENFLIELNSRDLDELKY